jgi:serine/threonine-protein kinase
VKPARGEAAPLPEVPGYRIESVLGRGSTGVVYRAVQLAVERVVALKVLHRSLSRGRIVRRLQREARTTARLSHPNIVAAIDMGQTNGLWWYAMEFVDGPSLAAHLRKQGRLTEREALRLFIPLCEALEHLHQHGVVHRDIKPGNILVEAGGRARLVDLGLAFAEDDPSMTSQGGTLGTPHYVSPEQARNPQAADVRSDIWSLGASLYHSVCGRPPFAGASVADILSSVLYARIPDPGEIEPSLSKGMRLVLRKCLARDPAGRYQTPAELLEDLERLRERRQVRVQRRDLDPVAGHEQRVRRLWSGAAVVAIAMGAIGLAVWRPWSASTSPGTEPAVTYWEDLELVADRVRLGPRLYASVLTELESLRADEVPDGFESRFREVHEDVKRRYDAEVGRLVAGVKQELTRLLERRELSDAVRLLDGVEARARRELNPSPQQLAGVLDRLQLETRRVELETAVAGALHSVERRLRRHYEDRVFARVDWKVERNQWRGAHEVLMVGTRERLTEARIETVGLPEERLDDLLDRLQTNLVAARIETLEEDWRRFDAELERWVNARAEALERELSNRTRAKGEATLRSEWEAHLEGMGLVADEMLELSTLATIALDQRARKLRRLESQYLDEDADLFYREKLAELEPLWDARDYRGLAREWRRLRDVPYLEPERAAIDLHVREAELLLGLLERAAAGVQALAGEGAEVVLFVGSIGVEGRVEVGDDPLDAGFRLRPSGTADPERVLKLGLRELEDAELLRSGDVERLAGITEPPKSPLERLRLSLFRWRSGDSDGAAALFPLGALRDLELEDLAAELSRRVNESTTARDLDQRERLAEAKTLIELINRVWFSDVKHPSDIESTVAKIDRVLQEFGDLQYVRGQRLELQWIKDALTKEEPPISEADLRRAFGASEVRLSAATRTVGMDFAFDATTHGGPWGAGEWVVSDDGVGWQPPGVRSREHLFDGSRWPRLVLRVPMDLENRLSVEVEVAQLQEMGPPKLLVVSVAGVHVGFLGDEHGRDGHWLIASGGPDHLRELVDALFAGEEGQPFPGLERGRTHRIRIELSQGRGRAEVYLDGELLDVEHQPRPGGDAGTASVVVRSLEVLRLLSANVEGSYTSR